MKVYIIKNEWFNDADNGNEIVGVYDSLEKAQNKILELYEEDINWISENYGEVEFEENEHSENHSFVLYEEMWSCNNLEEFEVK